ncbi:carbon-nitrogen hydrolase family protein [Pseudaestuariivita sp.]|uniref:carbon-nitrogen hydrolase family protein n=1 Tax=Pseudaestuariivita sp. TaxID=2211669 RepID=UPI0040588320
MRVATAAYPLDFLDNWQAYTEKLTQWVKSAEDGGADLCLFPEYGAMELATLQGVEIAGDLEASLHAVSERLADVDDLHADLAAKHGLYVVAASAPCFDTLQRPTNRARLFGPKGDRGFQDKQIMTRFEREEWRVTGSPGMKIFDTALGKIAILICYDAEFPLLGRAVTEADVILVPSCTEALSGYSRVRIGAQARALENQCVTVMSSTIGSADWSPAVDMNTGRGGVFGPPDTGFPPTGVIAEGEMDVPGWTFADIDLAKIAHVRADGVVLNRAHWDEQAPGPAPITPIKLR